MMMINLIQENIKHILNYVKLRFGFLIGIQLNRLLLKFIYMNF